MPKNDPLKYVSQFIDGATNKTGKGGIVKHKNRTEAAAKSIEGNLLAKKDSSKNPVAKKSNKRSELLAKVRQEESAFAQARVAKNKPKRVPLTPAQRKKLETSRRIKANKANES